MRPYLITAKLMRPSNVKRFPTPELYNVREHQIAYRLDAVIQQIITIVVLTMNHL
jgi:hypothetical protein